MNWNETDLMGQGWKGKTKSMRGGTYMTSQMLEVSKEKERGKEEKGIDVFFLNQLLS